MTQRERRMAIILFGIVVAGAMFLTYQLILRPLREYDETIATLERETETADIQLRRIRQDKLLLERWRQMSLPTDPSRPGDASFGSREYSRYLSELLYKNKFDVESFTPVDAPVISTAPGKKPVFTPLTYNVRAKVSLINFVKMLEDFQRAPVLHRIKSLTVARAENSVKARGRRDNNVTVQMAVEALLVSNSERRPTNLFGVDHRLLALDALTVLRRGPAGIALIPSVLSPTGPLGRRQMAKDTPTRYYADISKKNIFLGMPLPGEFGDDELSARRLEDIDVTRYTYLTDITLKDGREEAFYYIRTNKKKTRLRISPGFNSFRIMDELEDSPVVSGKVLKIESRDIYFQVGNNYYSIHVGQSFAEAMRRRLPEAEVKSLGLVASAK
jgi:hypothetical protein